MAYSYPRIESELKSDDTEFILSTRGMSFSNHYIITCWSETNTVGTLSFSVNPVKGVTDFEPIIDPVTTAQQVIDLASGTNSFSLSSLIDEIKITPSGVSDGTFKVIIRMESI